MAETHTHCPRKVPSRLGAQSKVPLLPHDPCTHLSALPLASLEPSEKYATQLNTDEGPSRMPAGCPVLQSHRRTFLEVEPPATCTQVQRFAQTCLAGQEGSGQLVLLQQLAWVFHSCKTPFVSLLGG